MLSCWAARATSVSDNLPGKPASTTVVPGPEPFPPWIPPGCRCSEGAEAGTRSCCVAQEIRLPKRSRSPPLASVEGASSSLPGVSVVFTAFQVVPQYSDQGMPVVIKTSTIEMARMPLVACRSRHFSRPFARIRGASRVLPFWLRRGHHRYSPLSASTSAQPIAISMIRSPRGTCTRASGLSPGAIRWAREGSATVTDSLFSVPCSRLARPTTSSPG
jgi:hypothetical protein